MSNPNVVHPLPQPEAAPRSRRVFVRDLVLPCLIGVHRHEQDGRQRVRINLDLEVIESDGPIQDRLANVMCYEALVADVRALVGAGHVNLVEIVTFDELADAFDVLEAGGQPELRLPVTDPKHIGWPDASPDCFCWLFAEPVALETPIPAKGKLNVWRFEMPAG